MPRTFTGSMAVRRATISFGGLVGEGDGQDAAGRGVAVCSSQAMRVVSTRVLPEPAPANIRRARWAG